MNRYVFTLLLVLVFSVESMSLPLAEDDVNEALAYAQALYYDARFKEAIQVLLRLDDVLKPKTGQVKEKTSVKLQLAVTYTGLNDAVQAKSAFRDLYLLDPEYRVDPAEFSPKVIALADQAKAEQNEVRCQTVWNDAQNNLRTNNLTALLGLVTSMKSNCPALQTLAPDAAELLYKRGLELYKQGDSVGAMKNFRDALQMSPKHELAAQYLELTQSRLQLASDRIVLDWRKNLDAHEYARASADYKQFASSVGNGNPTLREMQTEYRKSLSELIDSWKRACARNDAATMDSIFRTMTELLPEPAIGEGIIDQMPPCGSASCLQMDAALALTRLKSRINPDIPNSVQSALKSAVGGTSLTIRVRTKIDEKGDVTVVDTVGGHPTINDAVRTAVARWKFSPIVDQSGPRCVNAEIPIVIRFQ